MIASMEMVPPVPTPAEGRRLILRWLARHPDAWLWSVQEVALGVGLGTGTAWDLLAQLQQDRLVEAARTGYGQGYRLTAAGRGGCRERARELAEGEETDG